MKKIIFDDRFSLCFGLSGYLLGVALIKLNYNIHPFELSVYFYAIACILSMFSTDEKEILKTLFVIFIALKGREILPSLYLKSLDNSILFLLVISIFLLPKSIKRRFSK